jgi:hypothetical protein
MSWTVWGAARYLFPTYIIGMGLLLDAPLRWAATGDEKMLAHGPADDAKAFSSEMAGHRRVRLAAGAVAAALALTLAACLEQDLRLYREKQHPFGGVHLGWAYAEAARCLAETPHGEVCASNQPWILNLLAERPTVMAPRFQDAAQLRRFLARYRPESLVLFVTEREAGDVAYAQRLVEHLWTRPSLREEERGVLELRQFRLRRTHFPRQALLVMRVRQPGHGVTARQHAAPSTRSEGSDGC